MEIQIAVAKQDKYFAQGSGDTLEIIERPNGGISAVLADGNLNNQGSKIISTKVALQFINFVSTGLRDGSATKSVSNNIYREYSGESSASLSILSCDFQTNTFVVSRNSPCPVYVIQNGLIDCLRSESLLIGNKEGIRPSVTEIQLIPDTSLIMFSDGILNAGKENGFSIDLSTILDALFEDQEPTASEIAEFLLSQAVGLDQGEPADDMCVVAMQLIPQSDNLIRRMTVRIPLPDPRSTSN
ncbi:MAG: serine/threonine-protein phosphatase [Anaerolineaceae bacterium]|nr:serine/threonine-protein phosphatase [Anaerolineaceae bacterium]